MIRLDNTDSCTVDEIKVSVVLDDENGGRRICQDFLSLHI